MISYDPLEDTGVAIYNSNHSCSLATTFRSLLNEASTNDTIRRTLGSSIEASYTVNANNASSRFHLSDDSTVTSAPSFAQITGVWQHALLLATKLVNPPITESPERVQTSKRR